MTYKFNGKTLMESAQCPLSAADLARLVRLIDEGGAEGPVFIARWSPDTGVCFTGTVMDGELSGWMMFPAANEASARTMATTMHEHAVAAMQGALDPAQLLASDAIAKASRH